MNPVTDRAPSRPRPAAKIRRFQPYRNQSNTMLGYVDARLPSGMITNANRLMRGPNGKPWIAPPAVPQRNKDGSAKLGSNGKALWSEIIEFDSKAAREKYQELILEALRREHPEVLDEAQP